MRGNLVVVDDREWQLTHHGLGIGSWNDANIVALDGTDKGLSNSVALWTFDGHRSRFKTNVAGEAAM